MVDTDKILEAEQSIQNIALELKRMRDAAMLLQEAYERTDTILNAADQVVKVTGEFSLACGEIIKKLSGTDLTKRFDAVQGGMRQIAAFVNDRAKRTANAMTALEVTLTKAMQEEARVATLISDMDRKSTNAIGALDSKLTRLDNRIQMLGVEAKKRQIITIVVTILTLAMACMGFIGVFFYRIGG
jgi:hypothetical protein